MKAGMVAAAVLGVLASGGVSASADDGNELLTYCKQAVEPPDTRRMDKAPNDLRIGQCFGIMEGVKSTLMIMEQSPKGGRVACWPVEGINNLQAAQIVVTYLNNHPGQLNKNRVLLTILAFSDAYPCQ